MVGVQVVGKSLSAWSLLEDQTVNIVEQGHRHHHHQCGQAHTL
jgi:hypothetical protein